ncbi:MAG: hypothetical protein ACE5G9_14225 [Nitrospinales bacterium]
MRWTKTIVAAVLSVFLTGVVYGEVPTTLSKPDEVTQARLVKAYGKTPLAFEANAGQTDKQVKFFSRGLGYNLFLTPTESVMVLSKGEKQGDGKPEAGGRKPPFDRARPEPAEGLRVTDGKLGVTTRCHAELVEACAPQQSAVVRMRLANANPSPAVSGVDQLPGKSNYFTGSDPKQWRTNVANYKKVRYEAVYPGIDLVYYGNQRQLEYDFIVAPGADPKAIELAFQGMT